MGNPLGAVEGRSDRCLDRDQVQVERFRNILTVILSMEVQRGCAT